MDQPKNRQIRLSNAEREQAVHRLQTAMSEGRITVDEFEERTSAAYAALFAADLEPLLADLPPDSTPVVGPPRATSPPILTAPSGPPVTSRPGGLGVDLSQVAFPPEPVVIDAGWSTVKRNGQWLVPGWLQVRIGPGTVVLDCRDATFAQQITAIDLDVGMGTLRIITPTGVTADINGVSVGIGSVRSRIPGVLQADHPHLVCTGRVGAGALVIRQPYF